MTPASQTCGRPGADFEDGVAGDLQAGIDAEDTRCESRLEVIASIG